MIQFIFKGVLLFVLVAAVLVQVDPYFQTNFGYRDTIKAYQDVDKENLSIVFLGNSHSYSSFDQRIVEKELGASSMNLGAGAQRLLVTKVVADMVLKDAQPDLAVINIFKVSLDEPNNDDFKAYSLHSLDFLPLSSEKIEAMNQIFSWDELPTAYSETLRNHTKWPNIKDKNYPLYYRGNQDFYRGFSTYRIKFDAKTYDKFKKKYEVLKAPTKSLSSKEKKRIDEIISIFKNKKIPRLFVNAPSYIYDVSISHRTHAQLVAAYLESKGETFLEFNIIKDSIGLDKSHYRNPNHLNTNGAIIASQYLVTYLKDSLQFKKTKQSPTLETNRYYNLSVANEKLLFQKKWDSSTTQNLFGLEGAKLYKMNTNRYEIIFPLQHDTVGNQPFRLEYDITKDIYKKLKRIKQPQINFNKGFTKAVYYGTFSNKDIINYNGKNFVVFPFFTPLEKLKNVSFHAGEKRSVVAFKAETIELTPGSN